MEQTYGASAPDGPPPRATSKAPLAPPPAQAVAGTYTWQGDHLEGPHLHLRQDGNGTLYWRTDATEPWQHFSRMFRQRKGWHRIDDGTSWWKVTTTADGIRIDGPHLLHRTRTAPPRWSRSQHTGSPSEGCVGYSSTHPVAEIATRSGQQPTLFDPAP